MKKDGVFGWHVIKQDDADRIDMNTIVNEGATSFAFDSLYAVRKKLLDLSGRNTLLNYKHPKASCIRLIDELSDQIYDVLTSVKTFTFIPVPEPTENELIEVGYIEIDAVSKRKNRIGK